MPGFPAHRKVQGSYPYAKTKHHAGAPGIALSPSSSCSGGAVPLAASQSSSQTQGGRKVPTRESNKTPQPQVVDRKQAVYNVKGQLPISVQRSASEQNANAYAGSANSDASFVRTNKVSSARDASKRGGIYEPVIVRGETLGETKRLEKDPDGRLYEIVHTRLVEGSSNNNSATTTTVDPKIERSFSPLSKSNTEVNITRRKDSSQHLSSLYANPSKAPKLDHVSFQQACRRLSNKENISKSLHYSPDRPTQEAIERIKKNVEKKEEFLKRPNEPLWTTKDMHVRKEYQFSPQKMQRPLWPPPASTESPPGSITKSLSYMFADQRCDNRPLTRTISQMAGPHTAFVTTSKYSDQASPFFEARSNSLPTSPVPHDDNSSQQPSSLPYYTNPLVGNNVAKPYGMHLSEDSSSQPQAVKLNRQFVRTLSRIHENIPSSNAQTPSGTPASSQTSLSSSTLAKSASMAWLSDNDRVKQLQIVSTRAKKFEFPDGTTKNYTKKPTLHRFEISRLSQRGNASCNVAERKREFERRDSESQINSPGCNFEMGTSFNYNPRHKRDHNSPWRNKDNLGRGGLMKSLSDGGSIFPVSKDFLSREEPYHPATSSSMDFTSPQVTGNRMIPVGGTKIHCLPPDITNSDLKHLNNESGILNLERDRSNSTTAHPGHWSPFVNECERRKSSPLIRQHSFHTIQAHLARAVSSLQQRIAASNEGLSHSNADQSQPVPLSSSPSNIATAVIRRNKHLYGDEGDRLVRRVSYLKATSGDRIYSDSDPESDDEKQLPPVSPRTIAKRALGSQITADLPSPASFQSSVTTCGLLHVKLAKVQGKRASDRSWKSVWVVIRGKALLLYKDKQQAAQTPLSPEDQVTLRGANVGIATDYTKRRHVFRLSTPSGSQFLLQAESDPAMAAWLTSLAAATSQDVEEHNAKPDTAPLADAETLSPSLDGGSTATTPTSTFNEVPSEPNVSPQTAVKSVKKITSPQRSKLPYMDQYSKNKKASGESNSSPKSKTWKGKLGRHLRKMQGSTSSSASTPSESLPEGASIGVCLEDCPPSPDNEFVPLLVSLCVGVVEGKGLSAQGIYRVPGNRAAVTYLTDVVNKGPNAVDLSDTRWSDVNVISSLLKHFFRKLPDPLITSELYPYLIEASKVEDHQQRLVEIKHLVQDLPEHHYETLRFLCFHLHHVISQSSDNKMDVRNLAIVFGPTLVRAADDNMAKMVTDMSHQCQIVEMLLSHVVWFFNEDEGDDPPPNSYTSHTVPPLDIPTSTSEAMESSSQSLLLNNVQKLEANNKDTKKLLVSSIISAANRRVQKVRKKVEEETHPVVHNDAPQTVECPDVPRHRVSNSSYVSSNRDGRLFPDDLSDLNDSKLSSLCSENSYPIPDRTSMTDPSAINYGGSLTTTTSVAKNNSKSLSTGGPHSSLSRSEPSYLSDDVAIKSYTGLSASTQERIRRFELETRAMLQRDATRRRRELEKQKLEEDLVRAKKDMETEDIFDRLADNPSEVMHMMSTSWAPNREAVSLPSLRNQSCGLSLANASSLSTNAKDEKLHAEDQSINQRRPHNEGSDWMSAITATLEEKMKLLQEPHSLGNKDSMQPPPVSAVNSRAKCVKRNPESNKCKLYRDPSLHRRRTNLHSAPIKHSASSDAITEFARYEDDCDDDDDVDSEQKENKDKRSRNSTHAVVTETPREKRPKELKRSSPEITQELRRKRETLRQSAELQGRRHNVRELKEKFEQSTLPPVLQQQQQQQTPNQEKRKRKSRIKRRHTVGGMKDIARVAWLKVIEAAHYDEAHKSNQLPSWEQLQLFVEALAEGRRMDGHRVHSWVAKEKLDVDSIVSLVTAKESLKRRLSVREPKVLHPVLESNV